jgi:hypothetical protein
MVTMSNTADDCGSWQETRRSLEENAELKVPGTYSKVKESDSARAVEQEAQRAGRGQDSALPRGYGMFREHSENSLRLNDSKEIDAVSNSSSENIMGTELSVVCAGAVGCVQEGGRDERQALISGSGARPITIRTRRHCSAPSRVGQFGRRGGYSAASDGAGSL